MAKLFRKSGSRHWWVTYVANDGTRHRKSTKTQDKSTAQQFLASLEKAEAQKQLGVYSDLAEQISSQASQPIEVHIQDFASQMVAEGTGREHVIEQTKKLYRLADECDWSSLASISVASVVTWLSDHSSLSDRTRRGYASLAKHFCKWAHRHNRIKGNPLELLKPPTIRKRVLQRRALREDEWALLRDYLRTKAPVIRKLTGSERALLYELAIVTGLRANEICTLTVSEFVNSPKNPHIRVKSTNTKNAKPAEQSLTKALAASLSESTRTMVPNVAMFRISDPTRLATVLRKDLAAARSIWLRQPKSAKEKKQRTQSDFLAAKTHADERIDFHALRHTCGAWLALRGIHPKAIQRIMRHSKITLTLDTYGHLFPEQEVAAIEALAMATGGSGNTGRCAL